MAAGEEETWRRLKGVIGNEGLPSSVRVETCKLACEKADEKIAEEIVFLVRSWALELDSSRVTGAMTEERSVIAKSSLVSGVVQGGLERLMEVNRHADSMLDFLQIVVTKTWCSPIVKNRACEAAARMTVDRAKKREWALSVIASQRTRTQCPECLLQSLDSASVPELRELVRASKDSDTFHFHASAALAHMGDQEIVPHLQEMQTVAAKRSRQLVGVLSQFLWMISNQHPPSRLVDYIKSAQDIENVQRRVWAVRRAIELGIDRDLIRSALLEHGEQVKPTGPNDLRAGLSDLKVLGVQLDLLSERDWPDVRSTRKAITP
jgi:hypothetical protein